MLGVRPFQLTTMQLTKVNEDVSTSMVYQVSNDTWETAKVAIQRAIDEVRAIFRLAKLRQGDDAVAAACSIWSSVNDEWLDLLW